MEWKELSWESSRFNHRVYGYDTGSGVILKVINEYKYDINESLTYIPDHFIWRDEVVGYNPVLAEIKLAEDVKHLSSANDALSLKARSLSVENRSLKEEVRAAKEAGAHLLRQIEHMKAEEAKQGLSITESGGELSENNEGWLSKVFKKG